MRVCSFLSVPSPSRSSPARSPRGSIRLTLPDQTVVGPLETVDADPIAEVDQRIHSPSKRLLPLPLPLPPPLLPDAAKRHLPTLSQSFCLVALALESLCSSEQVSSTRLFLHFFQLATLFRTHERYFFIAQFVAQRSITEDRRESTLGHSLVLSFGVH